MSIRAMAQKYGVELPEAHQSEPGVALVFVVNRDFLPGLKILLYSMAKQQTLLDLPILFLSEDQELSEDEFVATAGDIFHHVTDEDIGSFQGISSARVPDRVRLDWIPKYTFLKWMIYDDYGFERLIWLDADILCLGPIDEIAQMGDADLYAAPKFPRKLLHTNNSSDAKPLRPASSRRRIRDHLEGGYQSLRSLNSGVLVANKRLLTGTFRDSLIRWAEAKEVPTEQMVLMNVLEESDDLVRGYLAPTFNFSHTYLPWLNTPELEQFETDIRLLHYVGARSKPWEKRGRMLEVESYRLWHEYLTEAEFVHPVFSLPTA